MPSSRKLITEPFGTDGQVVTWDASAAFAVAGPGTSGQVFTSNGAGAAPTFQAAAGGGGMWTPVSNVNIASSTASAEFTSLDGTYDLLAFVATYITPVTDNVRLRLRVEVSSTFQTTGYDASVITSDNTSDVATTEVMVWDTCGSATGETGNLLFYLADPSNTTYNKSIWGTFGGNGSNTAENFAAMFGGQWEGNQGAVTGLRIDYDSGNIEYADITMYGLNRA